MRAQSVPVFVDDIEAELQAANLAAADGAERRIVLPPQLESSALPAWGIRPLSVGRRRPFAHEHDSAGSDSSEAAASSEPEKQARPVRTVTQIGTQREREVARKTGSL